MPASHSGMKSARLEAFSDGVIAVIITIMVLELHVPAKDGLPGLLSILPRLGVYLLSFLIVGIYWINHHELLRRVEHVDFSILWSNLIFLFSLSLIPFFVDYLDEKKFSSFAVLLYNLTMMSAGSTFFVLRRSVMRRQKASGSFGHTDEAELWKHYASLLVYLVSLAVLFWNPLAGFGLNAIVTIIWITPGKAIRQHPEEETGHLHGDDPRSLN
jgi:uncharacterized membrane protein